MSQFTYSQQSGVIKLATAFQAGITRITLQRVISAALVATIAACVPFGTAGQGNVTPSGESTPSPIPAASKPSPTPGPRLSYIEGTVYSPAITTATATSFASGDASAATRAATIVATTAATSTATSAAAYRVAGYAPAKAAGALVHLSSPDERPYFDHLGRPLATTADDKGHFRLPVEPGKPLVITAVVAGDQRLVSFATLAATGAATVDISLESTYATEFLRRYAGRAGKTLADYGTESLAKAVDLTRQMLDRAELDPAPDLSAAEIPALVDTYLLAMAERRKDLSDLWASMLGSRPLAVGTLEGLADAGFEPSSIAVDPVSKRIFVASRNSTGVRIRESGRAEPVFRGLAERGFIRIMAMDAGPDGWVYFAAQVDRKLGAAIDWTASPPQIRLFRFRPGETALDEVRLGIPADLGPYLADTSLYTHIEPAAIAWNGGKLYMGDIATGLVYEFSPQDGQAWPGQVYAGRVTAGRPDRGNANGQRLGGAAFGGITHLVWQGAELFFPDTEHSVVRAIGADGALRTVAGVAGTRGYSGDGGPPADANLDYPQGLAFDAAGRLFIADSDNHRIRLVVDGRIRTVVGGGTPRTRDGDALDVSLGAIRNVRFDGDGNLLFTDDETDQVRRLWLQHGL